MAAHDSWLIHSASIIDHSNSVPAKILDPEETTVPLR